MGKSIKSRKTCGIVRNYLNKLILNQKRLVSSKMNRQCPMTDKAKVFSMIFSSTNLTNQLKISSQTVTDFQLDDYIQINLPKLSIFPNLKLIFSLQFVDWKWKLLKFHTLSNDAIKVSKMEQVTILTYTGTQKKLFWCYPGRNSHFVTNMKFDMKAELHFVAVILKTFA